MVRLKQIYWRLLDYWADLSNFVDRHWLQCKNIISRSVSLDPGGPVVSLTTYGTRVDSVFLTIESIFRNSIKPSRVILWLDERDRLSRLPRPLVRLQRRGLEIHACENWGPHKKYYPYVAGEHDFSRPLVTSDDDVVYPKHWLKQLIEAHARAPGSVICHRARTIKLHPHKDGGFTPYLDWPLCRTTNPSFAHLAVGVGGVLYPSGMQLALKSAGTAFKDCCPRADDLWLNVIAIRSGYTIKQINERPGDFPSIPGSQEVALARTNQFGGGNDEAINKTYSADDALIIANAAKQ